MTNLSARTWAELTVLGYSTTTDLAVGLVEMDAEAVKNDCADFNRNAHLYVVDGGGECIELDTNSWRDGIHLAVKERLRLRSDTDVLDVVNAVARAAGYDGFAITEDIDGQRRLIETSGGKFCTRGTDKVRSALSWYLDELLRYAKRKSAHPDSTFRLRPYRP